MGEGQLGQTAREPEVIRELNELQKGAESTYQEVLGLQDRLQGVLRSEPPKQGDVDKKDPTTLVPLASELRKVRQKVLMTSSLVNDIMQQLEL